MSFPQVSTDLSTSFHSYQHLITHVRERERIKGFMKAKTRNHNTASTEEINTNASTPVEDNSSDMTTDADLPLLDRNTYKSIKKMDRASLEELIQNVHESGRRKGRTEALKEAGVVGDHTGEPEINLDLRELEKQIKAVKGVGEKRAEEIMVIVEQWLGV